MSDDFTESVKRVLQSRVGSRCSDPECRALTSGPQDDGSKAVNVGVAAHITAASPGGARYDSTLTSDERSGHENGIWLCQNHGKLIDNDRTRFSVELLRAWKRDAENEARNSIGRSASGHIASNTRLQIGARATLVPIVPAISQR
jgi:hypothetical protein